MTLGLVSERSFKRHISDKIKDYWQSNNQHCITSLHTTMSSVFPPQDQRPLTAYQHRITTPHTQPSHLAKTRFTIIRLLTPIWWKKKACIFSKFTNFCLSKINKINPTLLSVVFSSHTHAYSWTGRRWLCDTHFGRPDLSTSENQYYSLPVIHSVGSDRGITHFFTATRYTTEGVGGKRTNEQYGLRSAPSARSVVWWPFFVQLFVHFVDYRWECIFREISTKLPGMPTHIDWSSLTASFCWPLSTQDC